MWISYLIDNAFLKLCRALVLLEDVNVVQQHLDSNLLEACKSLVHQTSMIVVDDFVKIFICNILQYVILLGNKIPLVIVVPVQEDTKTFVVQWNSVECI